MSIHCGLGSKSGLRGGSELNVSYREMLRKDLQSCEGLIKCVRFCNFVSLCRLLVVVKLLNAKLTF